jgi:hypothetical protein
VRPSRLHVTVVYRRSVSSIANLSGPSSASRFDVAVIRAQAPDVHLALDVEGEFCQSSFVRRPMSLFSRVLRPN